MQISASWIFNRICDEPERLKKELVDEMQARISRTALTFDLLSVYYLKYLDILNATKIATEIRLTSPVEIVVHQDKYIKVRTE